LEFRGELWETIISFVFQFKAAVIQLFDSVQLFIFKMCHRF
jgi:hypothetical protein